MKRGLNAVLILVIFVLIVVSLEVVSAQDVNLALNGTPEYKIIGYSRVGTIGSPTISVLNTNDNNDNSYIGFAGGTGTHQYFCGITEEIIHLRELSEIKNISYISWGCCGAAKGCIEACYQEKYQGSSYYNIYANLEETYVYNGTWNLVYSNKSVGKNSEKVIPGPWSNISKIKVYSALCQKFWNGYVNYKFYEIRAFGYETPLLICTPTTCSALGYNCGIWSNGTCGGLLDCGTCNAGESCLNGVCNKPCSSPDDIILKLFSSNNSHGALWNFPDYYYDICYSEIFGSAYAGANPHPCTGSGAIPDNKVLGLFQENNSHAEIPSLNNYDYDVCYGNLECMSVTDPALCPVDYQTVVRLFQDTNSHISDASDITYTIKICCKSPIIITPTEVYWANMLDIKINKTDLNDLVKLVIVGDLSGKNVEYEIYKSVKWWFDSKVATSLGGFTTWRAGLRDDGSLEAGQYYFRARIEGGAWISTENNADADYRYLEVIAPENNSPPSAIIISPLIDDKYKVNTGILFEQITIDEDDDLLVEWNFGDSTTKTCTRSQENCDTIHSYAKWGTKIISLTAKEIGRWQEANDNTRIFIYDEGINVFAVITEPPFGKIFGAGQKIVQFNANESYVANCTTAVCPSCTYTVWDLNCFDLSKNDIPGKYNLWFDWTFSETGNDGGSRFGNWSDDYDEVVEFERIFFEPTKHWANLRVGYESV